MEVPVKIDVVINVDEKLDETIEKTNRLIIALQEAKRIINSFSSEAM